MHLKRWLSSIVALPLVIYAIYQGGTVFLVFMSLVCVLSLREYFPLVFKPGISKELISWVGMAAGFFIIWAAGKRAFDLILWVLAVNMMFCAVLSVLTAKPENTLPEAVSRQIQGIVYIPVFLSFLVLVRNLPHGATWIFSLLCIIFAGDTGAYYVGTYMGRRKLIPRVSPGKTVEGALGGLCTNIGVGSLINWNLDRLPWGLDMPGWPWGFAVLFFISVGLLGQFGDLFESQLKRAANIKDSGRILPGHGGLLDRIDALLFAAPVAYIFKVYILG